MTSSRRRYLFFPFTLLAICLPQLVVGFVTRVDRTTTTTTTTTKSQLQIFSWNNNKQLLLLKNKKTTTHQHFMVRNIDLAEAIIFYGRESLFVDENNFQPGVDNLLQECIRDETKVLAVLEEDDDDVIGQQQQQDLLLKKEADNTIHVKSQTQPPPNPKDLWEVIQEVVIKPKGFGGSSGFGTKAADPERNPMPKHCVVLCHTEDQCRAARYAGMRVLCLNDNDLADAIMFDGCWESIYMDDIATPGSFWLNPPHPKDDEGNAVDPENVISALEEGDDDTTNDIGDEVEGNGDGDELSDDDLAAILADMDPL